MLEPDTRGESQAVVESPLLQTYCRVHIRWLIRRDIPEILTIDVASFGQPWTEDEFLKLLRERNIIGMVAERGEKIVGFMIYELKPRGINVLRFAVQREMRRQGVGVQMVLKLLRKLSGRRSLVGITVRENNMAAQLWLRACGWRAIRVDHKAFVDPSEDGYRFLIGADAMAQIQVP